MSESRTHRTKSGLIWGLVNKAISLVLPFLSRTIIIYELGVQYVGLGSLFHSILTVLSLAELGIGSAIVYSMYEPLAKGDDKKVKEMLSFYRSCFRIIGLVILCIGLAVIPFLDRLILKDTPQGINIYLLYLIYLVNTVISYFMFAYKKSILQANQRLDIISNVSSATLLLQNLIQIILLVMTKSYYLFALVIVAASLADNLQTAYWCRRLYPQYICEGRIERDQLRAVTKNVVGLFSQKIGTVVLSTVDTLVISAFLGLTVLSVYQNYYLIITSLFGILTIISNTLIPAVGNSMVTESKEKNYSDFKLFNFIFMWIVSWFSICLLCLTQPFVNIWIKDKELHLPAEYILLFALYFFFYKWGDMLYVYVEAAGIWWSNRFYPIIGALVNLVVNIVLVQKIGLYGILLSTILSVIFVYDFGYARVLFKYYFSGQNNLRGYVLRQLFYLVCTLIAGGATYGACSLVHGSLWMELILRGAICAVLPNIFLVFLYSRTKEEREGCQFVRKMIGSRG